MASVNKVIIIGNLGRDPDTRYTAEGGTAITTITVATSRRYKDSNGQPQEETEWHRVVFFGRQAEIAAEYLRKGRPVYIEGRLRTRKWQGPDGQDRYSTIVIQQKSSLKRCRCWVAVNAVKALAQVVLNLLPAVPLLFTPNTLRLRPINSRANRNPCPLQ